MRVRPNVFPKRARDWGLFLIVVIFVPFVYLVEVTVVLPYFHEPNSWMHNIHFILALFAVTNLSCNFLGIIVFDTSVPKNVMSSTPKPKWAYCIDCGKYVPPRSWHCKTCKICILKRDHHCLFSGCCVGHYNIRYFMLFLMYMCLSCLYALVYNTVFLYYHVPFKSVGSIFRVICPTFMVFINMDSPANQVYIVTFLLTLTGFSLSGVLLHHHLRMVLSGKVTHERNNNYNLGWKKNIELALGTNWHIAWLFPLIVSPLPHDGINWTSSAEWEQMNEKPSTKDL